ncbi:MAG: RDD family protein [Promethearchaeota archaeon]
MASAIKLIAGFFIILIGFPIFIGGSALLLVVPLFTDSQGYFMTSPIRISEEGYSAIRVDIPLEDIEIGVRVEPSRFVTLRMDVYGETSSDQVFLGLAEDSEVDKALTSNVSYVKITNFEYFAAWEFNKDPEYRMELEFVENESTRTVPQIDDVTWFRDTGETGFSFKWAPTIAELERGTLSLLLMNEDLGESNSIDITFRVGAKIPIINAIGWVLVVFGGLFTLLGIILVWSGLRTKKPRTERVRYYQGAPATRVDTVTKPTPQYQLQCSNCGSLSEPDSTFCSQCGEILLSEDRKTVEELKVKKDIEVFEPIGSKLVVAEGWPRFWAWLIDILITGAITGVFSSIIFFGLGDWSWWSFGLWSPFQWFFSLGPSSIVFFVYSVIMEHYYGQTLGKMALNLEVVSEATGDRPILQDIIISALGKSFFLPLDVILGLIAKDKTQVPDLNQRLTQKWAKTVIIQQSKRKESTQFVSGRV